MLSSSEMSGANHSLVLHVLQRFDTGDAVRDQGLAGHHAGASVSGGGAGRRRHVLFANGFPFAGHLHAAAGCGGGRDGAPIAQNPLRLVGALMLLLLLYTTVLAACLLQCNGCVTVFKDCICSGFCGLCGSSSRGD